jgi:LmbE family N-acetylglucosaminyl deacetylase
MTARAGRGPRHGSVLVVSPHYDDVPLSLGQSLRDGVLSSREVSVRVVFGRTNWSTRLHPTRRRAPLVTAWRRSEEAVAARRFGYHVRSEAFEEAILRSGNLDPSGFRGGSDPSADPLFGPVRRRLQQWEGIAEEIWVPAGLGRHVDHRIVAWAAADLVREGASDVRFYEDRPYASYLEAAALAEELDELGLDLVPEDVSGPIAESTQRLVGRCYRSQMDSYFREAQRHDRESGRPERVWRPVTPVDRAGSR